MPRHPLIGAVHGTGLYLGIELVRDRETLEPAREEAARVCDLLLGHGFIVQAASERQNVLKVKPPSCSPRPTRAVSSPRSPRRAGRSRLSATAVWREAAAPAASVRRAGGPRATAPLVEWRG
jgi:hypothetical protein